LSLVLVACLLLLVGCSTTKDAKPQDGKATVKVMKVGSVNPKARSLSQGFYKFQEIVEKESGGSIKVEVYPDGVLGDDRRTLEGLQLGSIQGTTVTTGPISSFSPTIGVFDLPFLFKDTQTAHKVLDGPIGTEMLAGLSKSSFIGLAYWENGFRHMSNSRRDVTTMDEMKGLKIRTMESAIHVDVWKALGVNPTPMSMSQVYTALEQKVVDGQENPLGNLLSYKLDEVQKHVTLTGHVYAASPFLVSKVFWDTLNDKEKEIMKKAAIEARDYQRKLNAEEDKAATAALTAKGVKVIPLKAGEKEKMQEAVKPIYEKYQATYGAELVKKVVEAAK
ncbi:DctP family TRAP transporter solute-binding subunit, partial [Anaerosporomusa subterranea]|uniref:DctP family TRAP transporter solute-binding subunit n=1 Tax=Anaerosporomusa subterranea TaxID=1794912 RepID=UPI000A41F867